MKKKPRKLPPLESVKRCMEKALAASTADEAEIVCFERRRGWAGNDANSGDSEGPISTLLIRVVEQRRVGWHRTETSDPRALEDGIRQALALARVQPRIKHGALLSKGSKPHAEDLKLADPEVAALSPRRAQSLLRELCREDEKARLSWSESRLTILNSHGLDRSQAATETTLQFTAGTAPGAGIAAGSGRSFRQLSAPRIAERARRRHATGSPGQAPASPYPVLLSPEATIELLDALNMFAFSGRTYLDGTSFVRRHRHVQVFDQKLNIRDDGTERDGLPFPFDLEGSFKVPLDLIVDGKPATAALDQRQGAEAGIEPTAQAVGGGDALCGNLFLAAGEATRDELLAAAEGGLWIAHLEQPECFEPAQLRMRSLARGVRKIENGKLGEPLPNMVWEDSILRLLARVRAIGRETVTLHTRSTPLGGICAPGLVVVAAEGLAPAG